MLANEATQIVGDLVVLVPYKPYHVPKYHLWMTNPDLRLATASEPLTLEEEYAMQQNWSQDDDKCTFILVEKPSSSNACDTIEGMIGDVNVFFNDPDTRAAVEIEVMIAESAKRGQGRAREAVMLMMAYAHHMLGVSCFRAKIGFTNSASLRLFNKLGFMETSRSPVFQEVTLEYHIDNNNFASWAEAGRRLCVEPFLEDLEVSRTPPSKLIQQA
eukprot:jgi/Botrbrau1/869/Bobra.0352s0058.2